MHKADFVIEAVRYKNGKIELVRGYERRGPAYTDRVLLDRKTLIERLKNKKRVVIGQRVELMAGTFELGKPVMLAGQDGKQVITTLSEADHDELEGTPLI